MNRPDRRGQNGFLPEKPGQKKKASRRNEHTPRKAIRKDDAGKRSWCRKHKRLTPEEKEEFFEITESLHAHIQTFMAGMVTGAVLLLALLFFI